MKFKVTKTSSFHFEDEVELQTIQELLEWCKKTGKEVIIKHSESTGELVSNLPELEIYDSWRE